MKMSIEDKAKLVLIKGVCRMKSQNSKKLYKIDISRVSTKNMGSTEMLKVFKYIMSGT